jgi:PIN domain associated with the TPR-GreAB-C-PIN system
MALPDRALSLLPLMTSAHELASGDVVLVGYSLGGLVIKKILRLANDQKGRDPAIASFLRRVRRIAFIATPHQGSDLALTARLIKGLLREPVFELPRNDANLRELNEWYRNYCDENPVQTLVLWENKESRYRTPFPLISFNVGQIVKPDSANPGVTRSSAYPVDADHFTIVQPLNRASPVFQRLQEFVERPFPDDPDGGPDRTPPRGSGPMAVENPLVTAQLLSKVSDLRQSRHAPDFDAIAECKALNDSLDGEFVLASRDARRIAASWCSRIVSPKSADLATLMLDRAEALGEGVETLIARAFVVFFAEGDRATALSMIADIDSDLVRSVRAILVSIDESPDVGLQRIDEEGLTFEVLDPDGKNVVLQKTIVAGLWDRGVAHVETLADADYGYTPALFLNAAALLLASTVNEDFRPGIVSGLPAELGRLPMFGDTASIERRRRARELYSKGARAFSELKRTKMAAWAEDFALWLGLVDVGSRKVALDELRESMDDREVALRRLPLALEFGLDVDVETIEAELEQKEVADDVSPVVAAARFALAQRKGSPAAAAAYIRQHREQLTKLYNTDWIEAVEIELLAKSGQLDQARSKLSMVGTEFPEPARQSLERIIDEASGSDPIEIREQQYAASGSTADLMLLVDALKETDAGPRLVEHARTLFQTTPSVETLQVYVQGLNQVGDDPAIIELYQSAPEMFSTHGLLQSLAWAHFRSGDLFEARQTLNQIQPAAQDANDRALSMNLSIASGDWSSLNGFVEEEWVRRDERTAEELLRAGQLAQHVGSTRSQDLIRAAVGKADGNAAILAACYTAATNEGWEDNPEVHSWLATAIETSGEDGPIQRVDIKDMLSMQPEWSERESRTWDQLVAGKLPIFGAAHVLGRSLLDMVLITALANLDEADPRRRGVVFAFSGARSPSTVQGGTVAIDASSLLSLAFVGMLDRVVAQFDRVFVSHDLLAWLFQERQRLRFHQPSRVQAALEIKRLIDAGQLVKFERTARVDEQLEREVGPELASLIAEAAEAPEGSQRILIRPYPVHKAGTFLEENADLSGYESLIAGCRELVDALKMAGQLTRAEEEKANAYLNLHEQRWPHTTVIQPGAALYLDSLAVDYLQHLGLLGRLRSAGFTVIVAASETEEGNALVRHQAFAEQAIQIIEEIRSTLSMGLANGKVRLGRISKGPIDHPTATFFELASSVEALVVDDRFLNRHANIDTGGGELKHVRTSLDLLQDMRSSGTLSADELSEVLARFRRGGFALVPASEDEIQSCIASAEVVEGRLVETAELRAIRESFERVRMTDILQLPAESTWLDDIHRALIGAIRSQWMETDDVERAKARSDWLLNLFDIRGWAHRAAPESGEASSRYRAQVLVLTNAPNLRDDMRLHYLQWLEDRVLARYREEHPEDFSALQTMIMDFIDRAVLSAERESRNA